MFVMKNGEQNEQEMANEPSMLRKMRRKRRCETLMLVVGISTCAITMMFVVFSIEVSYFLGVQIRPIAFATKIDDEQRGEECQYSHIVMVIGGFETLSHAATTIKSILLNHPAPIHFHILTDSATKSALNTFFQSWKLPAVAHSLYEIDNFVNRVSWIPNRHYSQNYGLVKLLLPEILPRNVEKVLLLDSDVLILKCMTPLLSYLLLLNSTQAFGMAENQSGWYSTLSPTRRVWPALGRGFNSGVALVDLKKLRNMEWNMVWRKVAQEYLRTIGMTSLADQDILNAVFKEHPELVLKLPCEYNLQLGLLSQPQTCTHDSKSVKIVHWNSRKKMNSRTRYGTFFQRKFDELAELDGNVFRHRAACETSDAGETDNLSYVYEYDEFPDDCGSFATAAAATHRTLLFFRPFSHSETLPDDDVTLVTQFSVDRLSSFEKIAEAWSGPISAAIYLTDGELVQLRQYFDVLPEEAKRNNIGFHAVFKSGAYYPINYLRNVALNATKSEFVFLADVDFIPSKELYGHLRDAVRTSNMTRRSLVIPAFEPVSTLKYTQFPQSKEDALRLINENKLSMFRGDVWPRGHSITDYDRWKAASSQYDVKWKPDYEPYIVVSAKHLPRYDERFVGFGWNKVTYLMALDTLGYTFSVLPSVFIVHESHPASFEITKYRHSSLYRKCMRTLRVEFSRDLHSRLQPPK